PANLVTAYGRGGCGGHAHARGQGRDAPGARRAEGVPLDEEGPHAADPGRPVNRETFRRDVGRARIRPGFSPCDEGELTGGVESFEFDAFERVRGGHFRLRGELHGEFVPGDPVVLERARARLACEECFPGVRNGAAEWRCGAESGDDDLAGHGGPSLCSGRAGELCVYRRRPTVSVLSAG